ncbi:wax ester/triacylglycerol synthase domain-containing protein [Streptomyces sp. NPDC091272]|uniref:wax ester/triacylglycerol synthase domain-containing protein n=1 Tax=Streptomyces sp. NPDC091272 TaxID=3365981 RepID=UPI0037F809BA
MDTTADGESRALTTSEALLWQAEESGHRLPVVGVAMLDGTPDIAALSRSVQRCVRLYPLLSCRVTAPQLPVSAPRWEPLAEIDLSYHLRRTALPAGTGWAGLLGLAQTAATSPFDRNRPLWDVLLVEGVDGGSAALVMRLHHAMVDGLRALELFSSLCDEGARRPRPGRLSLISPAGGGPAVPDPSPFLGMPSRNPFGAAVVGRGQQLVATGLRRVTSAGAGLRASRNGLCLPAKHSPALRGRSQDRRLLTLSAPQEDLRRSGRTVGGTSHDAFLAAVIGGVHHYHRATGLSWDHIPMAVAVALPARADEAVNRFSGVRLAGATGEEDPRRRLEQIHRAMRATRALPAIDPDGLGPISSMLAAAPVKAVRILTDVVTESDAHCTYVPGPEERRNIAGAGVTKLFAFAPAVNSAFSAAMCSYDATCAIGVNVDPRAVKDVELLHSSLRTGLEEVLFLGGK